MCFISETSKIHFMQDMTINILFYSILLYITSNVNQNLCKLNYNSG